MTHKRTYFYSAISFTISFFFLLLASFAFAQNATTDKPAPALTKHEQKAFDRLEAYAQKKILAVMRNSRVNEQNKLIEQKGDLWVASYYQYDMGSLKLSTKPVGKGKFMGLIKYARLTFQAEGTTKDEALAGNFILKKRRWLTEIARYEKGVWK